MLPAKPLLEATKSFAEEGKVFLSLPDQAHGVTVLAGDALPRCGGTLAPRLAGGYPSQTMETTYRPPRPRFTQ